MPEVPSIEIIISKILVIRGKKVMMDKDLALLYGVETRQLTRQVRRNMERFPGDFMFQLTRKELENLMCQFGTSSWGGTRKPPYVFTEQGVAMLSSVLKSKRAISVNIQIMRVFTKFNRLLLSNEGLKRKVEEMGKRYDRQFAVVFEAIKQLLEPKPVKEKPPIGFRL
jgi:hypothetical protein